jgi:hypothetical protein
MGRRSAVMIAAIALATVVLTARVQAGGWASVELDQPIGEVRVGEAVDVGFTVKQHGQTPIHSMNGQHLKAVFIAQNGKGGGRLEQVALPDQPTGHFRVQVVFPSAGVWQTEIVPEPFAGTRLSPVTVLSTAGERRPASAADEASIARAPSLAGAEAGESGSRQTEVLAAGMIVAAIALTGTVLFAGRRMSVRRK